jgi:hypothetical protein
MWKYIANFYAWFWYHSEFWIANKLDRRPYTYIMRDWIYTHSNISTIIVFLWFALLIVVCPISPRWLIVTAIFSGLLVAHLVWGSQWIAEQQENPNYNPGRRYVG